MLTALLKEHQDKQNSRKQELGDNKKSFIWPIILSFFNFSDRRRVLAFDSTNKFSQQLLNQLNEKYSICCYTIIW